MPPLTQQVKNAVTAGARVVSAVVQGKQVLVDEGTFGRRRHICETCPHNKKNRCELCGCFTLGKARLKTESCPDHRWEKV